MSPIEATKIYEHGTRARYVLNRCRCADCRRANTEYRKRRQRYNGYGLSAQVDAAPVREHVKALMSSPYAGAHDGIGHRRVADLAGVSRSVVSALVFGRRGKPTRRIKRESAERLMALGPDNLADASLVWAEDTWRYVNEMVDFGIPKVRIAHALGQTRGKGLQLRRMWVTVRNARNVERLHWQLFQASTRFRRHCGCPMPDYIHDYLNGVEGSEERRRRAGLA